MTTGVRLQEPNYQRAPATVKFKQEALLIMHDAKPENTRYHWGLREIMTELDVSQNQLAMESRVRPATLRAFVNGDVQRINLDQLTALLDALNRMAAAQSARKRYNVEDLLYYKRKV